MGGGRGVSAALAALILLPPAAVVRGFGVPRGEESAILFMVFTYYEHYFGRRGIVGLFSADWCGIVLLIEALRAFSSRAIQPKYAPRTGRILINLDVIWSSFHGRRGNGRIFLFDADLMIKQTNYWVRGVDDCEIVLDRDLG